MHLFLLIFLNKLFVTSQDTNSEHDSKLDLEIDIVTYW